MRRLPIYFVIDVSESMAGEPLYAIEEGLEAIVRKLRTDPHALDTVWMSVIAFAGSPVLVAPLTELSAFVRPSLPVGGGTAIGRALDFLMQEMTRSVQRNTLEVKGDWKPIVFLWTDGRPTDHVEQAVARWKREFASRATLIAVGIGRAADLALLRDLTEHAFLLEAENMQDFQKFIHWVTQTSTKLSQSLDGNREAEALARVDDSILKRLNLDKPLDSVDPTAAYFVSRCQKSKLPYLTRYEPEVSEVRAGTIKVETMRYRLVGCYPVKSSYFELSGDQEVFATVNANQLWGFPTCPHCGNPFGFAMCDCGHTFCIDGAGMQTCPWCEKTAPFSKSEEGDPGVDLTRARG